jgi:CDI immunity protein
MKILRQLFAKRPTSPFRAGERVRNLGCAPFAVLTASESAKAVGEALLQVLKDAMRAPIATGLGDTNSEWLKGLREIGFASANKLSYQAVCCSVTMTTKSFSILPTKRERRAFLHLPGLTITLPIDSSPEHIGKALRDGFSRCT